MIQVDYQLFYPAMTIATNKSSSTWKQINMFSKKGYFEFKFKIKADKFVELNFLNHICKLIHHDVTLQLRSWSEQDNHMFITMSLTLANPELHLAIYEMFKTYIKLIFNSSIEEYRYTVI